MFINDGESGAGIFGHGDTTSGKNAIRGFIRDFDTEGEAIADTHGFDFRPAGVEDADFGGGGFGGGGDANHVGVADGHHAEGDVAGGGVVSAPDFVDLVGLGHHDAVSLNDHSVGIHTGL